HTNNQVISFADTSTAKNNVTSHLVIREIKHQQNGLSAKIERLSLCAISLQSRSVPDLGDDRSAVHLIVPDQEVHADGRSVLLGEVSICESVDCHTTTTISKYIWQSSHSMGMLPADELCL